MTRRAGRLSTGRWTPYRILLPFFIFFVVFWLVPLIGGLRMSLQSDTLVGDAHFVGLAHYRHLLNDPEYFTALRNTSLYTLASIGAIVPLALFVSELLHTTWRRLRPLFSFLLLIPGLTPPAVLALLFLLVFHGRTGVLNQMFVLPLGFHAVNWLKDPHFILIALVMQNVWRWTGFITFFVMAGRAAIPEALYEAASLQTTSRWRVFWNVTFPMLRPVLVFCLVYLTVDAFSMFSGAYVLLGGSGGTLNAGLLMVTYVYQQAFAFGKFGTAAAVSFSVVPVLAAALALGFAVRWRKREAAR